VFDRARRWYGSNSYVTAKLTGEYVLDHHTAVPIVCRMDVQLEFGWHTMGIRLRTCRVVIEDVLAVSFARDVGVRPYTPRTVEHLRLVTAYPLQLGPTAWLDSRVPACCMIFASPNPL